MDVFERIKRVLLGSETKRSEVEKKIDDFFANVKGMLADKTKFLNPDVSKEVRDNCRELTEEISQNSTGGLLSKLVPNPQKKELSFWGENIEQRINAHNDEVAALQVKNARALIGKVEGRNLDDQQMKCIVIPASNHLVIAGAGTGKTTTIVGKVKYLLNSRECEDKDVLVLSFTNASASEMRDRICKETEKQIEASTFHKLGLNIINSVEGITPKITKIQLQSYVRKKLDENIKDPGYTELLCQYFLHGYKYSKSEFDFTNRAEYDDYLRLNPPVTLAGERVKSYGEMDIANFLFRNGIHYEYEKEYAVDTRTEDRFQYYPDFFLPDYGIYLEYFGINEKGDVPVYFSSRDGKTASEEYRESMVWKQNVHRANNTTLVECYAYERMQDSLLTRLEERLKNHGVVFSPISAEELWGKISQNNSKSVLTGIAELLATIISLMKSNECDLAKLRSICSNNRGVSRAPILIDILKPIYLAYLKDLGDNGEIDFNDMINKATKLVRAGKYTNPYKYVIIDEYQDISKSRYNLLKALRESSDYSLFCVGDDWQSIYRFAGSDLNYIIDFVKYWGPTQTSKIETTYRFSDNLIDISGNFVMKNPSQIRKAMRGMRVGTGFSLGIINGFTEKAAMSFALDRLRELPKNSSVFFLGRYSFDGKILSDCKELRCEFDASAQSAAVTFSERPDLSMRFLTAHRSKGLQADYVFIINNKDRGMGFPSKIQDDPIVDCLLEGREEYPYAEERRLFYVALTRAKIKTFLVVTDKNESTFAMELEAEYASQLKQEKYSCPLCGGRLEKKNGQYGPFWGCSNYRVTGCRFIRKDYSQKGEKHEQ